MIMKGLAVISAATLLLACALIVKLLIVGGC